MRCAVHDNIGQVESLLTSRDSGGSSLLSVAVFAGGKDTFDTVLDTVRRILPEEKVWTLSYGGMYSR